VALWDPSVDSGPNPAGAYGRVDGIIVTCKIVTIFLKIYGRVPTGRVLTNKHKNNYLDQLFSKRDLNS
jgi:hypothetical protein